MGEWLKEEGKLLTFNTPELGVFKTAGKKVLYMISVKVKHLRFVLCSDRPVHVPSSAEVPCTRSRILILHGVVCY